MNSQPTLFNTTTQTTTQSTTRPGPKTQAHQVLTMLEQKNTVCGSEFLTNYISRYSARIHDLRKLGWNIQSHTCKDPTHQHKAPLFTFTLNP